MAHISCTCGLYYVPQFVQTLQKSNQDAIQCVFIVLLIL